MHLLIHGLRSFFQCSLIQFGSDLIQIHAAEVLDAGCVFMAAAPVLGCDRIDRRFFGAQASVIIMIFRFGEHGPDFKIPDMADLIDMSAHIAA